MLFFNYAKRKEGLPEDHLYNVTLYTVPIAVIGARFVYVVTSWDKYKDNPLEVFNIRGGGLAIYGGIIGGFITVF